MSLAQRWTWDLEAPRDRLWRYLADTDWVNRHAGLPPIQGRFEPLAGGGTRRIASFGRRPLSVEWEERPTRWEAPVFFAVERDYIRGPLRRFRSTTALEPIDANRTRVTVDVLLEAASIVTDALLPLLALHGKRGADRAFRQAARLVRRELADGTRASAGPADLGPWQRVVDGGADRTIVTRIAKFIDESEDRELQRMRPYELADGWQLPRRAVLTAFLTATRAGLFNLRWSVLCPACRGPSEPAESLSGLQRAYHCEACNVGFGPAFDRSVEVTFDARPLGRSGDVAIFCIANPQRSAHVHAQTALAPRSESTLTVTLPPRSYVLRAVGSGETPFVASSDESVREIAAIVRDAGVALPAVVATGAVLLRIANESDREVIVRIEDGRWPDTIVTAAQVTALQEFRDLFSSEVLAPGLDLGIETLAVLFTDVVGSTAIYSRTGDAPAFRIVTDHFSAIRDTVARFEGTIVKTIGDAVMAAFVDPVRCLEAALALDRCVRPIDAAGAPLRLRVGFHAGPCIAMRANDRIDYFGTTVNLAARLQKLAGAGEVALARSIAERPEMAAILSVLETTVAHQTLEIKGFPQRIDVVRIAPTGTSSASS